MLYHVQKDTSDNDSSNDYESSMDAYVNSDYPVVSIPALYNFNNLIS